MKTLLKILTFFGLMVIFAISSRADTIFTTFGATSPGYQSNSGQTIGTTLYSNNIVDAYRFAASGTVTSLSVALDTFDYGFNGFTSADFSIASGAGEPGITLASFDPISGVAGTGAIYTTQLSGPLALLAGQNYWLVARAIGSFEWDVTNPSKETLVFAQSTNGGSFGTIQTLDAAFTLSGPTTPISQTPEPGSLLLLGTSLTGGIGAMRRKFVLNLLNANRGTR